MRNRGQFILGGLVRFIGLVSLLSVILNIVVDLKVDQVQI